MSPPKPASQETPSVYERLAIWIGASAIVSALIAAGEALSAPTLAYGACAGLVALIAFGVFLWVSRRRTRLPSKCRNVQLQEHPPAIIESKRRGP